MITFRIYALAGTGPWWLIDTGPGTPRIAAKYFLYDGEVKTESSDGQQPHKWLEIKAPEMYLEQKAAGHYVARFGDWSQCK